MLGSNGTYNAKVVGPGGKTVVSVGWAAGTNPSPSVDDVIVGFKANI
jgi:hypothetical protein